MINKILYEIKKSLPSIKPNDPEKIIEIFKNKLLSQFENKIIEIYLTGSYAIDDYNPSLSDIDFVVIIKQEFKTKEIETLREIHKSINKQFPKPDLNGIYIEEHYIGKDKSATKKILEYNLGVLSERTDASKFHALNPITWAELQGDSKHIYGEHKNEKLANYNWNHVDNYMYENINSYWVNWLKQSKNIFHLYYYLPLFRKSENAWCVSGVARQLYSLKENKITSKKRSCEYWIDKIPKEYENILQDTINYRSNLKSRKPWKQKRETQKFLRYAIEKFNDLYKTKYGS